MLTLGKNDSAGCHVNSTYPVDSLPYCQLQHKLIPTNSIKPPPIALDLCSIQIRPASYLFQRDKGHENAVQAPKRSFLRTVTLALRIRTRIINAAQLPLFRTQNTICKRLHLSNRRPCLAAVLGGHAAAYIALGRFHGVSDPRCWCAVCVLLFGGELRTSFILNTWILFLFAVGRILTCLGQPFNAFLSGFCAAIGQFVLTASLRMQTSSSSEGAGGKSSGKGKVFGQGGGNTDGGISHER